MSLPQDSWLTRNWRPATMLTFVGLIVARMLGLTPAVPEAEMARIWSVVEVGLVGYVVGRSLEKIVPQVIAAGPPPK